MVWKSCGMPDEPQTAAGLHTAVEAIVAESGMSGVVRVDVNGEVAVQRAVGPADRAHDVPNTTETQFGVASGTKGLTALTVMSLVEDGQLDLRTTARSVLGDQLPLIDDQVTVEHLLAHRSGIGDYLDEDEVDDSNAYVMPVPVHELAETEQFLRVLDGFPMKFEPGSQFSYCNGGYVVLALIAERVSGTPFHDLVEQRVCGPAGMRDTAFLRSDELPGRAALGYLEDDGLRTNVLHLPVRGNGDGGVYTTAADVHALWEAVFAGRIVAPATLTEMFRSRSDVPDMSMEYGLGFWLQPDIDAVSIHGFDAGVGFVSVRHRSGRFTYTVLNNKTRGAWPVHERIGALVTASGASTGL